MTRPHAVLLWVEDNPNDVLLMRHALAEAGVRADFVLSENAVLAYRYMYERPPYTTAPRPPDLILVDLHLPVIRGPAVIKELRSHLEWRNTPVVVLTSSSNPRELQECLDLGATACLTKPEGLAGWGGVVEQLRKYLPLAGRRPELARPESADPDAVP